SFGIMALNEFATRMESSVHREEQQGTSSWELYLEKRSFVLQFLHSSLSLQHLQHLYSNAELLKRCYFYLDIEPKQVNVRDQNHVTHPIDILQLIDPVHLQRMKKVGKNQTEIQLSLLTELLEQLARGWEELSCYVETYDMTTFLCQWDLIAQKLSKLSQFMETLISLQVPGQLYAKHSLVSHADLRGTSLPAITLSLQTKMPLIFDREASFAHKNWAKLKWFSENQESQLGPCELYTKLVTDRSLRELGHGRIQTVTSNTCVVQDLQPGRSYEFTIRRAATDTLVFVKWHDSIILKTKTNADE
ncbi:Uncharacterized protein C20orf195, partial [Antrostomus carolinensis]